MNINLHIERLVLDGLQLERGQGPHIQAAIEAELTRLLTEQGLAGALQNGARLPILPAATMQLNPGSSPSQLGAQIAHSVYTGIGNPTKK